jgi:hypothetical protein
MEASRLPYAIVRARVIRGGQKLAQGSVIGTVLSRAPITGAPLELRLLDLFPRCAGSRGGSSGRGVRRERSAFAGGGPGH